VVITVVNKGQIWVVFMVVKKGHIRVVITVVKKGQIWVVNTVVKSGQISVVNPMIKKWHISICNRMRPSRIKDKFSLVFSKFSQNCPSRAATRAICENFENTSEIYP